MTCKTCGETMIGDGYTVVYHCPDAVDVSDVEPDANPVHCTLFLNHYTCVLCGTSWEDQWNCQCDDDCPRCGTTMTPHKSEVVAGPEPHDTTL